MAKNHTYQITSPKLTSSKSITVRAEISVPLHEQRFSFRIECCGGKCCYNKIKERRDRIDIADKLHELCQITWGVINSTSKKTLGYEKMDFIKFDRSKLQKGVTIIGFVYHDNHRMFGFRDETGMFHIVGFDYDGQLYNHG